MLKEEPVAMRPAKTEISTELWTTKYRPTEPEEIIGNGGSIMKLRQWLEDWKRKRIPLQRCVLISGPPGIGKTTTATVIARAEGFKVLEYNASDTRSKKTLHSTILELLHNRSMSEYPDAFALMSTQTKKPIKQSVAKKAILIMDEVDGMSAGDRGGMAELIQLIKKTQVPIVCICNDRSSPKVRSLANYCLDLRFRRPDARQIYPRLKEICDHEGLHLPQNVLDHLVAASHGDIRQILNMLSTWAITKDSINFDDSKFLSQLSRKDTERGVFDIVAELCSRGSFERLSVNEMLELYFADSSLVPLMIQENYIHCKPSSTRQCTTKAQTDLVSLQSLSLAADSLAFSDIVDKKIHGANQEWSLAPLHGFLSTALPCFHAAGTMGGRIEFPLWLGQNSKSGKNHRILTELQVHMSLHITGGKSELRLNYLTTLLTFLTDPLVKKGSEGINQVISTLDAYTMLKDDYDYLLDLGVGKMDGATILAKIPTAVKSALTRTYNRESHALPYAISDLKKVSIAATEEVAEHEEADDDDVEIIEDDLSKDKMIRAKATKAKVTKAAAPKKKAAAKKIVDEDSYDEGDGFVVDDSPKKRRKKK